MPATYFDNLMASSLCERDAEEVRTELRFEFESALMVIEDVPALRCEGRDDLLVPGPLGVVLGDLAFAIAEQVLVEFAKIETHGDEPIETRLRFPPNIGNLRAV